MQFEIFHVPAIDPGAALAALNLFLKKRHVLTVEREFVSDGPHSFWSFCVNFASEDNGAARQTKKRNVDYREILNERDFGVYAKLRTLRKALADKDGVPAYALFTNEQLAAAVTTRATSKSALSSISGVGEARVEKYGEAFLGVLREAFGSTTATGQKTLYDEAK